MLQTVGGFDIAGLTGVFIGGAMYHVPIVLDGLISGAAALLAKRIIPGTEHFMIASMQSHCCLGLKISEAAIILPRCRYMEKKAKKG